jgi:DNA mismatch repair protein MutS2
VEGETADILERSRVSEARAADAMRAADEDRRRAKQQREETERRAREDAERLVADLRGELQTARAALERGELTAPAIDSILERVEDRLARAPAPGPSSAKSRAATRTQAPVPVAAWQVGDFALSRSGGWTGRIADLDRSKRRATLEAGSLRISVELSDLEPADSSVAGGSADSAGTVGAGTNVAEVRLSRARNVPMSLDLRGARVEEALAALGSYLEDASLAGLAKVTVIHGLGTGALRDAVRSDAAAHPLVKSARAGERGEGGDGVTVVEVG